MTSDGNRRDDAGVGRRCTTNYVSGRIALRQVTHLRQSVPLVGCYTAALVALRNTQLREAARLGRNQQVPMTHADIAARPVNLVKCFQLFRWTEYAGSERRRNCTV